MATFDDAAQHLHHPPAAAAAAAAAAALLPFTTPCRSTHTMATFDDAALPQQTQRVLQQLRQQDEGAALALMLQCQLLSGDAGDAESALELLNEGMREVRLSMYLFMLFLALALALSNTAPR
jgi:hypothetical protein